MGRLQSAKQSFTNIFPRKSVTKMEFYQEADFYELSEMLDDESSRSSSPYFVNSPPAPIGIWTRSSSVVGNVAANETASPPPAAGTSDSQIDQSNRSAPKGARQAP